MVLMTTWMVCGLRRRVAELENRKTWLLPIPTAENHYHRIILRHGPETLLDKANLIEGEPAFTTDTERNGPKRIGG